MQVVELGGRYSGGRGGAVISYFLAFFSNFLGFGEGFLIFCQYFQMLHVMFYDRVKDSFG